MLSENFVGFKLSLVHVAAPTTTPLVYSLLISPALDTSRCLFRQRQTIADSAVDPSLLFLLFLPQAWGNKGRVEVGAGANENDVVCCHCQWHPSISRAITIIPGPVARLC